MKRWWLVETVVAALGVSAFASTTQPFTVPSDVVTAIPLAAMVAAQTVVGLRLRRDRRAGRAAGGVADTADAPIVTARGARMRGLVPWIVLTVVVAGFELSTYFELPRKAHPTLSYLSGEATASPAGKAVFFLAWLALGWLFLERPRELDRTADL